MLLGSGRAQALPIGLAVGLFVLGIVVSIWLAVVTPAYVTAERSGVRHAWAALIPLGTWIILFETIRRNGWLGLLVFIPYVGFLVVYVWIAVGIPARHGRSGWWTLAFLIPGINFAAFWWYAFTLSQEGRDLAYAA
jgi:hypothetical protein